MIFLISFLFEVMQTKNDFQYFSIVVLPNYECHVWPMLRMSFEFEIRIIWLKLLPVSLHSLGCHLKPIFVRLLKIKLRHPLIINTHFPRSEYQYLFNRVTPFVRLLKHRLQKHRISDLKHQPSTTLTFYNIDYLKHRLIFSRNLSYLPEPAPFPGTYSPKEIKILIKNGSALGWLKIN